jgi:hypothetical protein
MVSDLFAGTPPGALVHPDYPALRASRGFLISYSLPPVAIALGRRALDIACAALARRVAESEVVQMAIGEAPPRSMWRRCSYTPDASRARRRSVRAAGSPRPSVARPPRHGLRAALSGLALERLCELDDARWVYDSDELGAIRRDVMTILTHHPASRPAAIVRYGRMLLARSAG